MQLQVAARSTSPGMTKIFHARSYVRFIKIQRNLRKRNFIERIKAPFFLESVLAIR